jgi:hypothetical protein
LRIFERKEEPAAEERIFQRKAEPEEQALSYYWIEKILRP